jgi:hypothetical protein
MKANSYVSLKKQKKKPQFKFNRSRHLTMVRCFFYSAESGAVPLTILHTLIDRAQGYLILNTTICVKSFLFLHNNSL